MINVPAPAFRDPFWDGASDPTLIQNREDGSWWMFYTSRRATAPLTPGVEWIHGSDIGIATTHDRGLTWTYRGIAQGFDIEWGRQTYWAPEIIDDGAIYHLYLSVVPGVPDRWEGHERTIRHYTSDNLHSWQYQSTLDLSSRFVIDACVFPLPTGGWRLWYKDEARDSHTWYADSPDLFTWTVGGPAIEHAQHEGPNVFALGGAYWMIVDEWHGLGVFSSTDLTHWSRQGLILERPGTRTDDGTIANHADVVPIDETTAAIYYHTHPDRQLDPTGATYQGRRTSIQVALLHTDGTTLSCDRDAEWTTLPLP